jgi:type II restriction enzyme
MKYAQVYDDLLGCKNEDEVFNYLISSFTDTIAVWDYFVNWSKVLGNYEPMELELHMLNYLIGKSDVRAALAELLQREPRIVRLIPLLLAVRETNIKLLAGSIHEANPYKTFNFAMRAQLSDEEIEQVCEFASQTGLLELFRNKRLKSVPDYVLGIEVGLDSNGRKNRSGTSMEKLVQELVAAISNINDLQFLRQATAKTIREKWGISVKVDKARRDFDFAINARGNLYLIETNYYGGSGSKLKSTAGEYRTLHNFIASDGHKLIWITDGQGWKRTTRPLREAFDEIDYILNLKMVMSGILEEILSGKL